MTALGPGCGSDSGGASSDTDEPLSGTGGEGAIGHAGAVRGRGTNGGPRACLVKMDAALGTREVLSVREAAVDDDDIHGAGQQAEGGTQAEPEQQNHSSTHGKASPYANSERRRGAPGWERGWDRV